MPISMPYFAATSGTKATTAVLNNHSDQKQIKENKMEEKDKNKINKIN